MFKKNEIKKALNTICKNEEISKIILETKADAEQGNGAFVNSFSVKLYSDELMEFLNDNSVPSLPAIDFGININLGELGNCASYTHIEKLLNDNEYNGRPERVCRIGSNVTEISKNPARETLAELGSEDDAPDYQCIIEEGTYITENGNVITTRETIYIKDGVTLLKVRTPDSSLVPSVSGIIRFFPEEERNVWYNGDIEKI